jgi:hypothetical protein
VLASFAFVVSASSFADCNFNGAADRLDISEGRSADCNLNGVPDECEGSALVFGPREERVILPRPLRVLTAADMDGDGAWDLISGDEDSVDIFRNQNDGSGAFEEPMTLSPPGEVSDVEAGDIDGDGFLDLAVVGTAGVEVNWSPLGESAAPAVPVLPLDLGRGASALSLGDFDADGRLDVVVANPGRGLLVILRGPGERDFAAAATYAAGASPSEVAIGDFDGDGATDLVAAGQGSGVTVLRGRGDGSFSAAVTSPVGGEAVAIEAADLDGDGRAEVVLSELGAVRELSLSDAGALREERSFAAYSAPLATGDFDRDGALDVAIGSRSWISIVSRDGPRALFSRFDLDSQGTGHGLAALDADGDGRLDIAYGDVTPSLRILGNGIEPGLRVVTRSNDVGDRPHSVVTADLDGDGDLDLAAGNGFTGYVSVLLNRGDGSFALGARPRPGGHRIGLAAGDIDGDGDLDLASADVDGGLTILRNSGGAVYDVEAPALAAGQTPLYLTAGDLSGDGLADVVSANNGDGTLSVFLSDGSGGLLPARSERVGSGPEAVVMADLDADGSLDLAAANLLSSSVSLLFGDGSGGFPRRGVLDVPGQPSFVGAADFDGDGLIDLATANERERAVSVFLGRGAGSFEPPRVSTTSVFPYSFSTGDVDSDGILDLVLGTNWSPGGGVPETIALARGAGDGSFSSGAVYRVGPFPRFTATADFDADGDLDFIALNRNSQSITVHLNQRSSDARSPYLERVCTAADFVKLSVASRSGTVERTLKYVAPARDDAGLLPALFQDSRRFALHEQFLVEVFPERFPSLSPEDYANLAGRRATRRYYAGTISRLRSEAGIVYGFSAYADLREPAERLRPEELLGLYRTLERSFTAGPLAYQPLQESEKRAAREWASPGFPIVFVDESSRRYEAYTAAVGFGRVRILDPRDFLEWNESGRFTFQDVVVLEEAPQDIQGVVGGVITGTIQNDLSHVSVRTSRRGTPNAFVSGAAAVFSEWEGRLVRLEVTHESYTVAPATEAEAETFWSESRPALGALSPLDAEYRRLDSLLELDLSLSSPESRYGGKATNFARLQHVLEGDLERYRALGFSIPVHYYLEFLRSNRMPSAIEPARELSFEEHIEELLRSERFRSDSSHRFEALERFRDQVEENGEVSAALVRTVAVRAAAVFGATSAPLRFRSSSNVEDLLEFNGAGLYESTSGCAADDLDLDENGPSRCNPLWEDETGIAQALKEVWASLWTFRAFEERSYYQIEQREAAMAILVTRAFTDEAANGVAFTGNPANLLDGRYVVSVQAGEESVVNPRPGVVAERTFLDLGPGGEVERIERDRFSSLLAPGQTVLSDAQYRELGGLLFEVNERFPIEAQGRERERILLDFELKAEKDGSVSLKQVRPFLVTGPLPPAPSFRLEVPEGTSVCGVFSGERAGRALAEEYRHKLAARLSSGIHELSTKRSSYFAERPLFEDLRFGPSQLRGEPTGRGVYRVRREARGGGRTAYRFSYAEDFRLPGGEVLTLSALGLELLARGEEPLEAIRVLDEAALTVGLDTSALVLEAALEAVPVARLSACGLARMPLWSLEAELEDGSRLEFEERFAPSPNDADTGPAALVAASVELRGAASQSIEDYWRLVYSAERHNVEVGYWAILEPALLLPGVERPVHAIEYRAAESRTTPAREAEALYLDESFEVIRSMKVQSERRRAVEPVAPPRFRRGDVNADGALNLSDAVSLLEWLFRGGVEPSCRSAADANADGALNLTDAVTLLGHLFQAAGPLPEPAASCGPDPSRDPLRCEAFPPCGG